MQLKNNCGLLTYEKVTYSRKSAFLFDRVAELIMKKMKGLIIMSNTFLELAKERYSVRKFREQQIEQEKLDKILEAGNVAPTAVNYQPQRIYVLQSEEALTKVRSLCPCTYGAPTVLLITYDDNQDWDNPKQPGIHSGEQDISIVATHMMLEAWSLGVASCWVNLFPNNELERAFDLPENEKTVLIMPLGYAADDAKPVEKWHFSYKKIEETVTVL